MNRQDQSHQTGVIITNEADRPAVDAFLARQGIEDAKWFALGDLDDLDTAVRHGRIHRVIAARPSDLLVGLWEQELVPDEWPAGTCVEYVAFPAGDDFLRVASRSWRDWRRSHRGRQMLAGGVLSFVVLGVSFVLCVWLAP